MKRILISVISTLLLTLLTATSAHAQLIYTSQQIEPIPRNVAWNTLIAKLQKEYPHDQQRLQQVHALLKKYEQIPSIKGTKEWGDIIETWHKIVKETDPDILFKRFKEVEPFVIDHQGEVVLQVIDLSVNEVLTDIEHNFDTLSKLTSILQKQFEGFSKEPLKDPGTKELYEKGIVSLRELSKNFQEYHKLTKKIRTEIEKSD